LKKAVFWDIRCVAIVRTGVSEEGIDSIIRVIRTGELERTLENSSVAS
jgi:hypothetical protein